MAEHTSSSSSRDTALDNLRAVAMLLGLVTHGVLPYTATNLVGFPIRDHSRSSVADACYIAVHDFRMQLFFLLAGFGAGALVARRGLGALARNRAARIALPLALASIVIAPLMHVLFAAHSASRGRPWDADAAGGWVGPNFHLWFLYYLLLCCVPLVAAVAVGRAFPSSVRACDAAVRWFLAWRWKLPVCAAAVVPLLWGMPSWWIDSPNGWAPRFGVWVYYSGFFLSGALLYRHRDLLDGLGQRWARYLVTANFIVLPLMLRLTVSGNWAEDAGTSGAELTAWKGCAIYLGGLYTWLMIAGLIGLFRRHVAVRGARWAYLTDASYWCYLAGFPVQAALQVWLAPHRVPIVPEFLLVNVLTFAVLLVSYEFGVRHTWLGLLLNGKRPPRREVSATAVVVPTRVAAPPAPVCGPRPVPAPAA